MRYKALDALRGVAAISVLFSHIFLIFPNSLRGINIFDIANWVEPATYIRYTPIRAFFNGRPAVVLFFVLSGFVLALPFTKSARPSYVAYLIKRICRIYIPFFLAIVFAVVLYILTQPSNEAGLSLWFNRNSWTEAPDFSVIAYHLLMTGAPEDMQLNNVMWSLVHEIRISIIFPLIALILLRRPLTGLVLFAIIWGLAKAAGAIFEPTGMTASLLDTCSYMLFFAIGTLLCYRIDDLKEIAVGWSGPTAAGLIFVSVCLFSAPAGFIGAEPLYGLASALIVILALSRPRFEQILELGPVEWLGRVSYSLYLVHIPILLSVFHLGYGNLPNSTLVAIVVATSLISAQIGYSLIEKPSMSLGRWLTSNLKQKRAESENLRIV